MEKTKNEAWYKVFSSWNQKLEMTDSIFSGIAHVILEEIHRDPDILLDYTEDELVVSWKRETMRREKDASRKRVKRLCDKIMAASSPEAVAALKAQYYPKLTTEEIAKVELILQEKIQEMIAF